MSRTITVNGTDRTSVIRLDSFVFVESAYRGEVGLGGYVMDDTAGTLDVPAHKLLTVTESVASPTRLHSGYIGERTIGRGPLKVSTGRQWDVMVTDLNTLLDDFTLGGPDSIRVAETDYQRITWLLTKPSMTAYSITAGQIPNTNTRAMDAADYRSSTARDVLEECSQRSGKNYFLYNWGSGNKLFYDKATSTSATTTATLRISNVATDVDSSVTFAPIGDPKLKKDPIDVYSTVRVIWRDGATTVTNATTASTFRRRTTTITDTRIRSLKSAQSQGLKYLADANAETTSIDDLEILVANTNVNDIRAGMRLEIKLPHLGYSAFTYARCIRREVRPATGQQGVSDVLYRVRLKLADDVRTTPFAQNDKKRK